MMIASFEIPVRFVYRNIHLPVLLSALLSTVAYSQKSNINSIGASSKSALPRERISINEGWRFMRYTSRPDSLFYDERPMVKDQNDSKVADTRASELSSATSSDHGLKKWILPSANDFIKEESKHQRRPGSNPGAGFPFVQNNFNDSNWQLVNLPHDWAIMGPFYKGENAVVGGGMGRLPVQGVAWYRRKIQITTADKGKNIYLDVDGAMSYAIIWLNGRLVGGWPYGYNSFRLDLTPYVNIGGDNQLAIRLDNPTNSSRWYPGGGIYRNVWLTKVAPIHVKQWGTFITTKKITSSSAALNLLVQIENNTPADQTVRLVTGIYSLNETGKKDDNKVASFVGQTATVQAGKRLTLTDSITIENPKLWGPPPTQQPNLYMAVTTLYQNNKPVDVYQTQFGIRSVSFDPLKGVMVNGQPVRIQGVNQHHDLGALGAAFNERAAERQLEVLKEMGCNAIRFAHNPPAPELLELTDRMGFLVIDEIFDCWQRGKTPLDFHLIFNDWHEADLRAFIRRDRNHPSVIEWSFGNEVGEQYTAEEGASLTKDLYQIVHEEDSTRPATASMNYAKPNMPFPKEMDVLSLNYQGEGIRDAPAYSDLKGIRTSPLYPAFQKAFPGKMIQSSETASALSTRGTYIFPVTEGISAPVSDSAGSDSINRFVSAYDLYTAAFGASPDKVFAAQDHNPYVAGEFVWSGWDYLGEPTPYYSARSSYSGIIDLAGFKKDRFYLYQSRWRSDLPMAHILPHWTWKGREGKIIPVHVYTSGDEAELFLNGKSLGKKKNDSYEYRLRWDSVIYEPGELKVVAYKNKKEWATDVVKTAQGASALHLKADRNNITADGKDLLFITASVVDENGTVVPKANNLIHFNVSGSGEIVATDNGNPADLTAFPSHERAALSGFALAIIKAKKGKPATLTIRASAEGLKPSEVIIQTHQ